MLTAEGSDFSSVARTCFTYLRSKLNFDLWMVTRHEADAWIVLQADDRAYGLEQLSKYRWDDTFCSRMVAGTGPHIAPRLMSVPAYYSARFAGSFPVGAYVGVPIRRQDGEVFGTLCAMDPKPQPESIELELPLLEMAGGMLSSVLSAELQLVDEEREKERIVSEAETDALTGILNRQGWERLRAIEEGRCRRYGNAACVVLIDLDGLRAINELRGEAVGDRLIRRTARALTKTVRSTDIVARVGGDEFAVLGVQCNPRAAGLLLQRIRKELERAGISASVGMSSQVPATKMEDVWREADDLMLDEKISRKLRKTAIDMRRLSRSQIYRPKNY